VLKAGPFEAKTEVANQTLSSIGGRVGDIEQLLRQANQEGKAVKASCIDEKLRRARNNHEAAQTVMEVQGGGSSLVGGYGATANFWRNGMDGWVGLGYLDGLRVGAFLRAAVGRDTVRLGNDALVMRFPTDLFSSGYW
jgi:hypothetical protein